MEAVRRAEHGRRERQVAAFERTADAPDRAFPLEVRINIDAADAPAIHIRLAVLTVVTEEEAGEVLIVAVDRRREAAGRADLGASCADRFMDVAHGAGLHWIRSNPSKRTARATAGPRSKVRPKT